MKVYFVDFSFIQNSLSFTTNVICDLSNATSGILVINITCNQKLILNQKLITNYQFSSSVENTLYVVCLDWQPKVYKNNWNKQMIKMHMVQFKQHVGGKLQQISCKHFWKHASKYSCCSKIWNKMCQKLGILYSKHLTTWDTINGDRPL